MFSVCSEDGIFWIFVFTSESFVIRVLVPSMYFEITSLATLPFSNVGRPSWSVACGFGGGTPTGWPPQRREMDWNGTCETK